MDVSGHVGLSRQSGLMGEMRVIANNLANMSTTGYRAERIVYSEFVASREANESVSFANGNIGISRQTQGALQQTGSELDLAIEGEGFFRVSTSAGDHLTRAGSFSISAEITT